MNATRARDHAATLAKSDPGSALRAGRAISDPWFRAQALASVARFSADSDVERIANESLAACAECDEPFKRLAAAAWPLRALLERGYSARAREVLNTLLEHELDVEPPSSRSEALFLLFQACFGVDAAVRKSLIERLASAHRTAGHWRSRRNLIDALSMLRTSDPELVERISTSIKDERIRIKVEARAHDGRRSSPREFFW